MLIRNKKSFYQGLFLILSFAVLFWGLFLPLFKDSEGGRINSLQWADAIFNQLSKGSSWFVPEVVEDIEKARPVSVSLSAAMPDALLAEAAITQLKACGITDAQYRAPMLDYKGELGAILKAAARDSADLYENRGSAISRRYGYAEPLTASLAWWHLLSPAVKELQKAGEASQASLVEEVIKKAIEPGNNFYGLPVARVADNILLVCSMLAFYVLYAVWYGFAIYRLFAGFGLLGEEEARENVEESEI